MEYLNSIGQRNFWSHRETHCTCYSCAQRLQHGHCSSPGVKVCWRRYTSWRGRRIHTLLVWQAWRRMKGIWSMPGYQEVPCSKAADSACCCKWPDPDLVYICVRKWHLTIVNVYAPTLTNTGEVKKTFYSELKTTISSMATSDKLLLLLDFNAQIGREIHSVAWHDCLPRGQQQ